VRQVILRLLLPADEQPAPPRQPGEGALHYPATRRVRFLALLVFLLFADTADMSQVAALRQDCLAWLVVIAFVQAQVLRFLFRRLWAFHDDGIERGRQQQVVVHVRARDADRKWAASLLDQQALLDAQLATVGGVRADAFAFGPVFGYVSFRVRLFSGTSLFGYVSFRVRLFSGTSLFGSSCGAWRGAWPGWLWPLFYR